MRNLRPGSLLPALALLCFITAGQAATLTVSPTTISNEFLGPITFQIGGLTNAETVRLEKYFDINGNGVIDAGDLLTQSFLLTDGSLPIIGGVRNSNVPGDDDGSINGQIMARINFESAAELSRSMGPFIVRVSSPSSRFAAVTQPFTVTQAPRAQTISGTVTGPSGAVANALVGALVPMGNNAEFFTGARADGTGHFSIALPPGGYQVIALKAGLIGNFATMPFVDLAAGVTTNVSITLSAAPFAVSGSVIDMSTLAGIPGVQFFLQSDNNDFALGFVDSAGNFSFNLAAGNWKLDPSERALAQIGYLRPGNKLQVNVTANTNGQNIALHRVTALIYGTITDSGLNPLGGIDFNAEDSGHLYNSVARSDSNGNYMMGVTGGSWNVGPSSDSGGLGGLVVQSAQVTLSDGQAVRTNFVAIASTAHIIGRAIDSSGAPIGDVNIGASTDNTYNSVQTDSNGNFDIPVYGGQWNLQMSDSDAMSRGMVGPSLSLNITDGVDVSNLVYIARSSNRQISGSVKNSTNGVIAGISVFASTTVNGTNYYMSAQTDPGGNYNLPAFNGVWSVSVDDSPSTGLTARGYSTVPSQNVDLTAASGTANFVALVISPAVGFLQFRHFIRPGDFGRALTPAVQFPVSIFNYSVTLTLTNGQVQPATNVFFTGPPGSGLANTAADPNLSTVTGSSGFYSSPRVSVPSAAPGGTWDVKYGNLFNRFIMPDPQANSRIAVPIPTVSLSNGIVKSVSWIYKDATGATYGAPPPFMSSITLQVFDHDGLITYTSPAFLPSTNSHVLTQAISWPLVSTVRFVYRDTFNNVYPVIFSRNAPGVDSGLRLSPNQFQFKVHGLAAQNYSIEYSTDLTTWFSLGITNFDPSPLVFVDGNATNKVRFYRVKQEP